MYDVRCNMVEIAMFPLDFGNNAFFLGASHIIGKPSTRAFRKGITPTSTVTTRRHISANSKIGDLRTYCRRTLPAAETRSFFSTGGHFFGISVCLGVLKSASERSFHMTPPRHQFCAKVETRQIGTSSRFRTPPPQVQHKYIHILLHPSPL